METKYILKENCMFRSYRDHMGVLIKNDRSQVRFLNKEELFFLFFCDGSAQVEECDISRSLEEEGWIRKVHEGEETLKSWQKHKICDNRFMACVTLEITERCNCNCLHCFNATGVAVPRKEMPYEMITGILDQMVNCGIPYVLITGGEPMLHPRFLDILKAIQERGMFAYELNTNGTLLDQAMLDQIKAISPNTKIKISYDGVGFHDTMRGMKGCEKKTLEALKRSVQSGFVTRAQINMNRLNSETILPTLLMLNEEGIQETRVTRTTEAPRWSATNPDGSLSWPEYFSSSTEIAREYLATDPAMYVEFWLFLSLWPLDRRIWFWNIRNLQGCAGTNEPMCPCASANISISADGSVFPCLQMYGAFNAMGIELGNVNKTPLQEIIENSLYAKLAFATVQDRIDHNERCRNCPQLGYCGGGRCTLMGMLSNKDYYGSDDSCCIFFRDHWYERVRAALPEYKCRELNDPGMDVSYLEALSIPDKPVLNMDKLKPEVATAMQSRQG